MLIGHLPVGYFVTRSLIKKLKLPTNKLWLGLGLMAAILPDFDIAYTILIKESLGSHRYYNTNYPAIYLILLALSIIVYFLIRKEWLKLGIIIVFVNIFIHLLIDTVFVGIKWFWPFYDNLIGIYNVGLTGGVIVENYFTHWYWYLEIVLWIAATVSVIISYKKGELR